MSLRPIVAIPGLFTAPERGIVDSQEDLAGMIAMGTSVCASIQRLISVHEKTTLPVARLHGVGWRAAIFTR